MFGWVCGGSLGAKEKQKCEVYAVESIFEITTVHTKSILRQVCARVMRGRLILHALLLMATAAVFALFVILRQIVNAYFFAAIFCLACISLAVYRFFSVPEKYAEQTYTDMVNTYREPIRNRICVYSGRITVENLLIHTVHSYDAKDCTGLLETHGILLLKTRKNSYIILDKTGFTKGTPEAFTSFFVEMADTAHKSI